MNNLWVERKGFCGVKPSVPSGDTEYMTHPIEVPQTHHELPDNGVETRAKTSAGHDGSANVRRLEVDMIAGSGAVVGESRRGRGGGAGEVERDLMDYDVVLGQIEGFSLGGVKVRVVIHWVGSGLEVRGIVGEVGELLQVNGFEDVGCVN